jgi:hypothetical protein
MSTDRFMTVLSNKRAPRGGVSVFVLCRTQLDEEREKIPSSTHGGRCSARFDDQLVVMLFHAQRIASCEQSHEGIHVVRAKTARHFE